MELGISIKLFIIFHANPSLFSKLFNQLVVKNILSKISSQKYYMWFFWVLKEVLGWIRCFLSPISSSPSSSWRAIISTLLMVFIIVWCLSIRFLSLWHFPKPISSLSLVGGKLAYNIIFIFHQRKRKRPPLKLIEAILVWLEEVFVKLILKRRVELHEGVEEVKWVHYKMIISFINKFIINTFF